MATNHISQDFGVAAHVRCEFFQLNDSFFDAHFLLPFFFTDAPLLAFMGAVAAFFAVDTLPDVLAAGPGEVLRCRAASSASAEITSARPNLEAGKDLSITICRTRADETPNSAAASFVV
jgi:hypothetical protein